MIDAITISNLVGSIAASGLPMAESSEQFLLDYTLLKQYFKNKEDLSPELLEKAEKIIKRFVRLGKSPAGEGHDCAIKGVNVSFNLTKTQSFDHQIQRYNWINYVSSMSTMHRIQRIDLDKASHEYVSRATLDMLESLRECYLNYDTTEPERILDLLESYKIKAPSELTKRALFEVLIMNVPSGFKLTVRVDTNYMQLKTIYHQRKRHKMTEWQVFTKWIETLPLMKEILQLNTEEQ